MKLLMQNFYIIRHNKPRLIKQAGFTLLELIVVIGIITIVLGVSAPRIFGAYKRGQLRSEANMLATTFRYSQGMAAVQRATYRIHFNIDKNSYHLSRDSSRGDDFELTDNDLMASGDYGLFPGQRTRYMPDDEIEYEREEDEWLESDNVSSNRNAAGRVDIFDEESHSMPNGIKILKIVDGRNDVITEGSFVVSVDPKGRSIDTSIYIGTDNEEGPVYIVHIGVDGIAEVINQDLESGN